MRSTTIYAVVLAAGILLLAGLTQGQSALAARSLGSESNGQTISAGVGERFTLSLPENPSTGYSWQITSTGGLDQLSDRFESDDRGGLVVGAGGMHVWEFRVTEAGEQRLTGVYRRPWEAKSDGEKTYSLSVNVGATGGLGLRSKFGPGSGLYATLTRFFRVPESKFRPFARLTD